jgi:predicted outer membrane repeat protein
MANYTVSTLGDELFNGGNLAAETADGNGLSLREALALANGNASTDDITFAAALAGGTLFLAQGNGQLSITTDGITIDGDIDGNATADITIDADSAAGLDDATSRIFFISDGAASTISTTLNGLVIRDGVTGGSGGAIYLAVADALTLTNATISGNTAGIFGGGIFGRIDAAITLINSTVSGNSADDEGGGIFGLTNAALTLTNATVSGNSAGGNGGGIYGILNNPITLTNSTVTGNRADGDGGAIYGGTNSTITLTNSIVAGNAAAALGDDLFGDSSDADLAFVGGNVIGSTPEGFASVTGAPTAQVDGVDQAALATVFALVANDPNTGVLSGVLADNGGPVATVAIGRDSVAHDAGDTNVLPPDTHGSEVRLTGVIWMILH